MSNELQVVAGCLAVEANLIKFDTLRDVLEQSPPNLRRLSKREQPESLRTLLDKVVVREKRHKPILETSIVETDFTQLVDGTICEIIENPEDPSRSTLAVFKNGNVGFLDQVRTNEVVLVPPPKTSELFKNVRLPRGVAPYESVTSLLLQIGSVLDRCIELEPMYSFLLANYILTSWVVEGLEVAPNLALVGLSGSGKLTLLRLLSLLCRRSILAADITSSALLQVCDRLTPTLLIDQMITAGQRSKLFHLLKGGSTPGATVYQKGRSFKIYGLKVVSWTELPDDPVLNGGCIVIPLQEATRRDLTRITDPGIQERCIHLQKQLLMYRFDHLNSLKLPRVDGDERLYGHARDLYEALALANGDPGSCEKLVRAFQILQEQNREALRCDQTAVLRTLFYVVHSSQYYRDNQSTSVGDMAGLVNRHLHARGERSKLTPRAVGAILTSFGIARRRCSWGCKVLFDRQVEKRIHELVFRYGLDGSFEQPGLKDSGSDSLKIERTYDSCESCRMLHRDDFHFFTKEDAPELSGELRPERT